jgi:hypothetical protein
MRAPVVGGRPSAVLRGRATTKPVRGQPTGAAADLHAAPVAAGGAAPTPRTADPPTMPLSRRERGVCALAVGLLLAAYGALMVVAIFNVFSVMLPALLALVVAMGFPALQVILVYLREDPSPRWTVPLPGGQVSIGWQHVWALGGFVEWFCAMLVLRGGSMDPDAAKQAAKIHADILAGAGISNLLLSAALGGAFVCLFWYVQLYFASVARRWLGHKAVIPAGAMGRALTRIEKALRRQGVLPRSTKAPLSEFPAPPQVTLGLPLDPDQSPTRLP